MQTEVRTQKEELLIDPLFYLCIAIAFNTKEIEKTLDELNRVQYLI